MNEQMISPPGTPAHNGHAHAHAGEATQVSPHPQHQGQALGGPPPQAPQPQQRTFAPVGGPPAGVPALASQQAPAQESFFSAHKRDIIIGTGAAIFGAMFLGNTGKVLTDVATSATNSRRNQG